MVYVDSHAGSTWMDGLPWLCGPAGWRAQPVVVDRRLDDWRRRYNILLRSRRSSMPPGNTARACSSKPMSDRGNQVILGTFIATFVYSLIVLRTIRSAGERGAGHRHSYRNSRCWSR
ncbi:DUF2254 family protein [Sphingomonas sp. MMS24-JH45]